MDLSKVCRTCLSTDELRPISGDSVDQDRYKTTIYNISGLKIEKDDGLPQQICKNCIEILDQTQTFHQKCLDTNHLLRNVNNKPEALHIELKIEKIEVYVLGEKIKPEEKVEFEDKDDYKMEFIDFDILEEEDKPLKYIIDKTVPITKVEKISNVKETETKADSLYSVSSQNRVTCKLCGKDLSIRSVVSHMSKKHPGADERRLKCELCDKYILKTKLNRHMKLLHAVNAAEKCLRCSYCKEEFSEKQILIDHVTTCMAKTKKKSIHDPGRQIVECDVCSKKMQRASLKMHKAITHAGLGPVCEHCGKRFSNKLRLTEHRRARHAAHGYHKLRCSYCDFASASDVALRNHERRHRNEKPFVCEACGAKFHAAYLLAQHRQSHRTEKLIKCNLCPAAFKANNSLHTHKRLCHSATQHTCNLCGRAYASKEHVARHLRRRHKLTGPILIPPNIEAIEKQE